MTLGTEDRVLMCVEEAAQILRRLDAERVLSNGNLEKQLKFFVALAWEHEAANLASVMDKSLRFGAARAEQRGASNRTRERAGDVARVILKGDLRVEPGRAKLLRTRGDVEQGCGGQSATSYFRKEGQNWPRK